jgi:hypothetical protein
MTVGIRCRRGGLVAASLTQHARRECVASLCPFTGAAKQSPDQAWTQLCALWSEVQWYSLHKAHDKRLLAGLQWSVSAQVAKSTPAQLLKKYQHTLANPTGKVACASCPIAQLEGGCRHDSGWGCCSLWHSVSLMMQ